MRKISCVCLNDLHNLVHTSHRFHCASVLFTNESRFKLYDKDARSRVHRAKNERFRDSCVIQGQRFGGGSVMIWEGISMTTKSAAVMVREHLNAIRYPNVILLPACIPHLRRRYATDALLSAESHRTHC